MKERAKEREWVKEIEKGRVAESERDRLSKCERVAVRVRVLESVREGVGVGKRERESKKVSVK